MVDSNGFVAVVNDRGVTHHQEPSIEAFLDARLRSTVNEEKLITQ